MSTPESACEQFNTAVTAHQRGDLQAAERGYRAALAIDPDHASSHNNLGLILAMTDRLAAAIESFEHARRSDPHAADPCVNLAQALQQAQRYPQALAQWQHATALSPRQMTPPLMGATLAIQMGELDQAMKLLEQAADGETAHEQVRLALPRTVSKLGAARLDAGEYHDAHRMASLLGRIDADGDVAPRMLVRCLRHVQLREFDAGIKNDLLLCYRSEAVDHRELARSSAQLLLLQYPVLAAVESLPSVFQAMSDHGVHRDPLLLALLCRSVNTHPDLERALSRVRAELLSRHLNDAALDAPWLAFTAALALHCFTNEYVFTESATETAQVHTLSAQFNESFSEPFSESFSAHPDDWSSLAVLLTYRTPSLLDKARQLAHASTHAPAWIAPLLERSLLEPVIEQQLRDRLVDAEISDAVSRDVRSQYEESPYPRWQNLALQIPLSVAELLRDNITNFSPPAIFEQALDILIAGCGTGEHALRVAARHPQCRVHAIDLSRASLAYALRKARELKIDNIEFQHRDILDLGEDMGPYAMIESVGVIHHMRDPDAGLAALCNRLTADGIIKLGLYSRRARSPINAARARIIELGLDANAEDIRRLRERILNGQEPQLLALCQSQDFYTMSTVRDLLFHVQEHQYDPQQVSALLDANGLHIIGMQVPGSTRQRYLARFPDDPALVNLEHWNQFEQDAPGTFAGMYQFWCQRQQNEKAGL